MLAERYVGYARALTRHHCAACQPALLAGALADWKGWLNELLALTRMTACLCMCLCLLVHAAGGWRSV
jgi:hypothetical protein